MEILASKGNLHFCKYESGLYTVDKITKNLGMTLYASYNKIDVAEFFNKKAKIK